MLIRESEKKDGKHVARIQVETWRATYKNIIDSDYLNKLSIQTKTEFWEYAIERSEENKFLLILESDNNPCGFVSGGPHRVPNNEYIGEIYALYIDKNYQGKKMGTELFKSGILKLKELGFEKNAVWVLKENPYYKFYEKMNGTPIGEKNITMGNKQYVELGYGWK